MKSNYERIVELEKQVAWLVELHRPEDKELEDHTYTPLDAYAGKFECACGGQCGCGPKYTQTKD